MIATRSFEIRSSGRPEPMLITGQIERLVRGSGQANGLACIFVPGSGAVLLTLDCPGGSLEGAGQLIQELLRLSDVPDVLSNLTSTSQVFPIVRGQLQRATWQEILLVDFVTEERWHHITVQMLGE